uniref:Adenylylsulfate reductase n=1 Tax=Archaeoglobus fulgidus TaxID=2234 RepID=Q59116_ARCFL|nr:adenylylsulfate reductase [Archaeoglobus fulgidus]
MVYYPKKYELYKADEVPTEVVETDILIIGGGFSGCGAAYEAAYWAKVGGLKLTLVEKAAVERSGAVAQGLSAINTYIDLTGRSERQNTLEDYVRYVTLDMMGLAREDLVADYARHVDGTVHLFEKWGLPIWKTPDGKYVKRGTVADNDSRVRATSQSSQEAGRMEVGKEEHLRESFSSSELLKGKNDPNAVAGAVGFSVREPKFYVFKAKAVILATGGATLLFRPRSTGEAAGRTWYAIFDTGSGYYMGLKAGAMLTQFEHRFIPFRFKDGYGPVGAWFLFFKCKAKNAYGEEYIKTRAAELEKYKPYGAAQPIPTPLRNHQVMLEIMDGNQPIYMHTERLLAELAGGDKKKLKHIYEEAFEDFLDMTVSQALLWACQNIDPQEQPSEAAPAEPYIMGSHSGEAGFWVCGPEDLMPEEYAKLFPLKYNRMTTVKGLFAIGDCAGANPHKFSRVRSLRQDCSEGAVMFIPEQKPNPEIDDAVVEELKKKAYAPMERFMQYKDLSTADDVNPEYILPWQGLVRLQKIMDEYAAGIATIYKTNEKMLQRALELLAFLKEDLEKLAARDLHELMRAWELVHRVWTAEAHVRHMLFRKETRWPGYYYRTDYPELNDEEWKCFVCSKYDAEKDEWTFEKVPYVQVIEWSF